MSDLKGINEEGIDNLVLDIFSYIEKINGILTNIDRIMAETSQHYICESGSYLRNKFIDVKENFSMINTNMVSYTEDLVKVKHNLRNFSSELASTIIENSRKIDTLKSNDYDAKE